MKKILIVFLLVTLLSIITSCQTEKIDIENEYTTVLKMKNNSFTILNLTDIQLTNKEWENVDIKNQTTTLINNLINETNPQLITITGDTSYGEELAIRNVCEIINNYDIPFCPIFGNHEFEERELTINEQIDVYTSYDNCLLRKGKDFGNNLIGNYVVDIVKVIRHKEYVIKTLIFVNSGSSIDIIEDESQTRINKHNYAKLTDDQVNWINHVMEENQKYGYGNHVSGGVFLHIPISEFFFVAKNAYNVTNNQNVDSFYEEVHKMKLGEEKWNYGYENASGVIHESICSYPYNDFVFERLKNINFFVAGHDHINNFIIESSNTKFVYGLKTGIGCYSEKNMIGGTVIKINKDGNTNIYHIYQ